MKSSQPMDIVVRPEVEKGIKSLTKYAEELNIQSFEDASDAGIKLFQIAEHSKTIEDQRTEFTKPLNLSLRSINSFFKRFSVPLETIDAQIREKLVQYAKTSDETAFGVVHMRKNQIIEVTDESAIPRKYMMPNMAKIKVDLKDGKTIAGVEIREEKSVSL